MFYLTLITLLVGGVHIYLMRYNWNPYLIDVDPYAPNKGSRLTYQLAPINWVELIYIFCLFTWSPSDPYREFDILYCTLYMCYVT